MIGCDDMQKDTFFILVLIMLLIIGLFFLYMGYSEFFADMKNTRGYTHIINHLTKHLKEHITGIAINLMKK